MRTDHSSMLTLRMLSRSAAKSMPDWRAQPLPFALVSGSGHIERTGEATIASLGAFMARVKRVVIIVAASDVTLLRMAVPPLSAARLKVALPALVEDRLITDPAQCALAAGPDSLGMRTIAVIERDWLREIVEAFSQYGARRITAYAAQACLPLPVAGAVAAITPMQDQLDLALRLSEHEGMGLPLLITDSSPQMESEVCQNLQTLTGHRAVELMVPAQQKEIYQYAADQLPADGGKMIVTEDDWQKWISGAQQATPDLIHGLETVRTHTFVWHVWRWPLLLAALLLGLNVIALYGEWWQLKNEGDAIRASMTHRYQVAFPDDRVIVDPLAQLQQKISVIHQGKGEVASDDFLMLTAILTEALKKTLTSTDKDKNNVVAAVDYRNAVLQVRFKPGFSPPLNAAKTALAARNIQLAVMPEENQSVVWQIGNTR